MARSVEETAAHIGLACFELSKMAREAEMDVLAHLLEMASLEAANLNFDAFTEEPT